ncbi:MAG: DoxX family protein [Cytophagaceae bacterium]|nr:DoxX family protein [Cytophagaceae bacterium]
MRIVVFLVKLLITAIVGQTLFFKFTGAVESIYIFSILGVEPWGRLGLGSLELLSIVLLWIPKTALYALILILGMMSGAMASHLFILGIEIMGDQGELFILGVVTWLSAALLLFIKREEIKILGMKFLVRKHAA